MKRSVRAGIVIVLAGLCILLIGNWSTLRPALQYAGYRIAPSFPPDQTQTLQLPGLDEPATVYLDEAGIAHIAAASERDLARAVGFVQGRSRFFQMDMLRRLARGRVSELVGEQPFLAGTTLDFDRSMRAWGIEEAADRDADELAGDARALMEAFAAGVNASRDRYTPFEYRILGVEPEPWTMGDSFALGRFNAWTVSHNWHQELSRWLLALHGGLDRANAIYPSEPWAGYASLPGDSGHRDLPPVIAAELREVFVETTDSADAGAVSVARFAAQLANIASASNSWVVGGDWTASGAPMVAGDPHLTHFLPSLLFQMHLKCPGLDVIGVTIPGLPFVLAGHNEHVAWNVTAANADVMDLYLEWPNPDQPTEVMTPDGWAALEQREEVFRVRRDGGMDEQRFVVRRSRHGPLLNDIFPGLMPAGSWPLAVRWLDEGAGSAIAAGFAANKARSVQELREAMSAYTTPPSIWTAADTSGAIALFPTGSVPVRRSHRGTMPAPGWIATYDWDGTVSSLDLPHGVAGPEGFFAHSNNLLAPPYESAVHYQTDSAPSFRVERAVELIQATRNHTTETFAAMQRDLYLKRAAFTAPHILEDLRGGNWVGLEAAAFALFDAWNFDAPPESPAPAIYYATYLEAVKLALEGESDTAGVTFVLAQRYSSNAYDVWFTDPDHPAWDNPTTERTETRLDVVREAFRRAVPWLRDQLGDDPGAWRWGALHDLRINHLFGSVGLMADFVNLPPAELGGGPGSIWKTHFDLSNTAHPFRVSSGPVFRTILDLSDMKRGLWIIDTGNSGWPGSPHYGDQYERWRRGEYFPMVSDWETIQSEAKAVISLVPVG